MQSRKYKTLNGLELQHFFTVEIRDVPSKDYWGNDITDKKAFLHSTIHVNKFMECGVSWSDSFSDEQILRDHHLIKWVFDKVDNPYVMARQA